MIVHRRTSEEFLAAVPHSTTVAMLRSVVKNLLRPTTVGSLFQKDVVQFSTDDSIVELLRPVIQDAFSFFPVRNVNGFSGMLTGNGVMRWVANRAQSTSAIDISEVTIGQVLQLEEGRENHKFVPIAMDVDDAVYMFSEIPELEALFITDSGNESEELRGMMTVWDAVRFRSD